MWNMLSYCIFIKQSVTLTFHLQADCLVIYIEFVMCMWKKFQRKTCDCKMAPVSSSFSQALYLWKICFGSITSILVLNKKWSYWNWQTLHPSESIGLVIGRVYSIILCSDFSCAALKLYFNSMPDPLSKSVGKPQYWYMLVCNKVFFSMMYDSKKEVRIIYKRENTYVSYWFISITPSPTSVLQTGEICEKEKAQYDQF